ncbi:Putative general negative regulator of transcription C16C9.04c [Linum grandiflorum]
MVSDSINLNASVAPRDFAKKKRANRSARLKQCKLDARREQWLSQGTGKSKEQKMPLRASPPPLSPCKTKERKNPLEKLETRGRVVVDDDENENGNPLHHHDFDTDSPSNSPTSNCSVLGATDSGTNSTASSSCSGNSAGSCSGNITEEEEDDDGEEQDDNCLDDWETMADALAANVDAKEEAANDDSHSGSGSSCEHEPRIQVHDRCASLGSSVNLRPEFQRGVPPRATSCNARAWRPDDAFRPQSLPTLSKQRSFPNPSRPYGQVGALPWSKSHNMPSCCPICCEDLDPTDSSFSPCTCGFRLCLFCHKRILEEDGRCPSCRKPYQHSKVEAEPTVLGGSLTVRLARSCSMRS